MDKKLKRLIKVLRNQNTIGQKHIPENIVLKSVLRDANKHERKEFFREYESLTQQGFLIRLKKRTGKGNDWHISLNPEKLKDIMEIIGENDETSTGWSVLHNIWEDPKQ